MQKSLPSTIKFLLFLAALTPIIYTPSLLFPFVFGKILFFRAVIEIAFIIFVWYFFYKKENVEPFIFHPIIVFSALFSASVALSTVFAVDGYRAFWGDVERGGGLFGILHFLAFIILSVYFFTLKDWLKFFKISVIVGAVIAFYGWLQFFGNTLFPFALPATTQPGSFLGNPAYLSSYLILLIGASFVIVQRAPRVIWQRIAWLFAVFFFLTIFITQIRGAILGAGLAILFFLIYVLFVKLPSNIRSGLVKRGAAIFLFVCVLGVVVFWFTRTASLWQSVPGIKRLARESYDIASVSTRFIALGVSRDAFLEKPVLGWGSENYNIAYNKYYDPDYSYYAEDWFDRAHNKLVEVAVMQGVIGLAVYLALFGAAFYAIFRRLGDSFWLKPLLAAVLVAYFVQNLFIFDTPVSYLLFFTLLGFIVAETKEAAFSPPRPLKIFLSPFLRRLGAVAVGVIVVGGSVWALYFGNFIPFAQTKGYVRAVRTKVGEKILAASDTFLFPYSFAQSTIRDQFSDLIYDNGLLRVPEFRTLTDKVLTSMEELVEREPYEPRHFIRLVENYSEYAKDDHSYFVKADEYARKALALSPERQGIRYHVAFVLSGEEKYDEAVKLAEETVALNPEVYKSQYQLGIIYSLYADAKENIGTPAQEEYRKKAREQFTLAWEMAREQNRYIFFLSQDYNNLISIYRILGNNRGAAEVLEVALKAYPNEQKFYVDAMAVYRDLREKDKLIETALTLGEIFPETKDDTEVIIDLAEKEKWNILDTL